VWAVAGVAAALASIAVAWEVIWAFTTAIVR
jgi:hypothetical protein